MTKIKVNDMSVNINYEDYKKMKEWTRKQEAKLVGNGGRLSKEDYDYYNSLDTTAKSIATDFINDLKVNKPMNKRKAVLFTGCTTFGVRDVLRGSLCDDLNCPSCSFYHKAVAEELAKKLAEYSIEDALLTLKQHNAWRTDRSYPAILPATEPKALSKALDFVIDYCENNIL
jgi:hypothetical protein